MRKFFISLFIIIMYGKSFAEPSGGFVSPFPPIYAHPDVVEYAIEQYVVPPHDPNKVRATYEKYMNPDNGTITVENLKKVCEAGGMNQAQCTEFTKILSIHYYDVCDADKGKSNGHCVDKFFYSNVVGSALNTSGTHVREIEALELARLYASVKDKQNVVCVRSKGKSTKDNTIWCTSIDQKHFYEFKFNDIHETKDTAIKDSLLAAVCKIHDTKYQSGGTTVQTALGNGQSLPSYSWPDACLTADKQICANINKSLKNLSRQATIGTIKTGPATSDSSTACVISGSASSDVSELRTAYDINNKVFQDVKYVAGNEIQKQIKQYVKKHMENKKIKFDEKSFHCDSSTNIARDYSHTIVKGKEVITCYVNDKPVDFLFATLSENKDYAKNSGLSKMACIQMGGKVDNKKCRGLDEQECKDLGTHLVANGISGTKYLQKKGGCVLSAAATEETMNLIKDIAIGIAITVVTEGTATVPVVISIEGDLAFKAIQIQQEKIPYKDYKAFIDALNPCYGMKPVAQKWCFGDVLNKNYKLLVGEMTDLAPEVQADLVKKLSEIQESIGTEEYVKKASSSEISLFKKARGTTQYALLIGMVWLNPEKIATEIDDFARLRKMVGNDDSFFKALEDFQRSGRTARFLNTLSPAELNDFNNILRQQNIMVELERTGSVLTFKDLTKATPSPAQIRSTRLNQIVDKFGFNVKNIVKRYDYMFDTPVSTWQEVLLKWNLSPNATDDMIESYYQNFKYDLQHQLFGPEMSGASEILDHLNSDYNIIKRTKPNYGASVAQAGKSASQQLKTVSYIQDELDDFIRNGKNTTFSKWTFSDDDIANINRELTANNKGVQLSRTEDGSVTFVKDTGTPKSSQQQVKPKETPSNLDTEINDFLSNMSYNLHYDVYGNTARNIKELRFKWDISADLPWSEQVRLFKKRFDSIDDAFRRAPQSSRIDQAYMKFVDEHKMIESIIDFTSKLEQNGYKFGTKPVESLTDAIIKFGRDRRVLSSAVWDNDVYAIRNFGQSWASQTSELKKLIHTSSARTYVDTYLDDDWVTIVQDINKADGYAWKLSQPTLSIDIDYIKELLIE